MDADEGGVNLSMFTELARQALNGRGVSDPTTEQLRQEMMVQHLKEAAILASLLGQEPIAKKLERIISKFSE